MTRLDPYDIPTEEKRNIRIVLKNIEWDALPFDELKLPNAMSVPVDRSLPEEEMISKAIDSASSVWGFCINDCDVEPIELEEDDSLSLSDTLEYEGKVY